MNNITKKQAILLIDLQNDFITGTLKIRNAINIIDYINNLISKFKKKKYYILATKDWHLPNHISFRKNKKLHKSCCKNFTYSLWNKHCVQNTWGSKFNNKLNIKAIDKIFYKGLDKCVESYSAISDCNNQKLPLYKYIKNHKIKRILVVGLALDYCVYETLKDLTLLNIKINVDLLGTKLINNSYEEYEKIYQKLNRKINFINEKKFLKLNNLKKNKINKIENNVPFFKLPKIKVQKHNDKNEIDPKNYSLISKVQKYTLILLIFILIILIILAVIVKHHH